MQQLALNGMAMWSVWQPDRGMYFNSFFLQREDGNIVVDPLATTDDDLAFIRGRGGLRWIVITNRDHERRSRELAATFGAQLCAGEKEVGLLSGPVARKLAHNETFVPGIDVVALDGGKTPGEIALSLRASKAAIVGDALWGDPAGSLRLPPDDKLQNPALAVLALRRVWALRLDVLLVGDGACIFAGADKVIGNCLQQRRDVDVNRINIDELEGEEFSEGNERYAGVFHEIGLLIGARRLGYQISTILPGKRFCPLHVEDMEEEMFIVWEGEATIRTLRGEFTCRRGDVIAFPTGDVGAHQVMNNSDQPCQVFMLGAEDPNSVCYYPDSNKVLMASRNRLIVRAAPSLDYYDGET